jgi:hypothetical protein
LATDLDGNLREDILQGLYEYEKSADDDGHQVLRTGSARYIYALNTYSAILLQN